MFSFRKEQTAEQKITDLQEKVSNSQKRLSAVELGYMPKIAASTKILLGSWVGAGDNSTKLVVSASQIQETLTFTDGSSESTTSSYYVKSQTGNVMTAVVTEIAPYPSSSPTTESVLFIGDSQMIFQNELFLKVGSATGT